MCSICYINAQNVEPLSEKDNPFDARATSVTDVEIVHGKNIWLKLSTGPNVTACTVITPDGTNIALIPPQEQQQHKDPNITIYWDNGSDFNLHIYKVTETSNGTWQIKVMTDQKWTTYFYKITVIANPMSELNYKIELFQQEQLNISKTMLHPASDKINYCDIIRPNGDRFDQYFSGTCDAVVPRFSAEDAGNWTMYLGTKSETQDLRVTVDVSAKDRYEVGVQPELHGKGVNLYFNIRKKGNEKIVFCRFIRPYDKVAFLMSNGLGNENYSYYRKDWNNTNTIYCGITIKNPDTFDYGSWKCILRTTSTKSSLSTYINFNGPNQKRKANDVKTLKQDAIENYSAYISCNDEVYLRSCFLTSPLGERFIGQEEFLLSGHCVVRIDVITPNHAGIWKCNLVSYTGQAIIVSIDVRVKASNLLAVDDNVTSKLGSSLTLMCRLFSNHILDESLGFSGTSPSLFGLTYCRYVTPDGRNINTNVLTNDNRYKVAGAGLQRGECGLTIVRVTQEDSGVWTCAARTELELTGPDRDREIRDNITVTILEVTSKVFPSSVQVEAGNNVILQMEPMEVALKTCNLVTPDGGTINLNTNTNPTFSYWGAGLKSGECGVKIFTEKLLERPSTFTIWELIAKDINGVVTNGIAEVTIRSVEEERKPGIMFVELGTNVTLYCSVNKETNQYCIFVPPTGKLVNYTPGPCNTTVPAITREQTGNWTCYSRATATAREVTQTITVVAKNVSLAAGSKLLTPNLFELYCHWQNSQPLKFCRFVRPDGKGFRLADGMGHDRYDYKGTGLTTGQCGLTINGPTAEDIGMWTCFIGIEDESVVRGAHIDFQFKNHTGSLAAAVPRVKTDRDVSVVMGSPLVISCRTNMMLSYCWLLHPNGTHLQALDTGLGLGECSVTVQEASPFDSGIWSCNMAILGWAASDLVHNVSVTVAATSLRRTVGEEEVDLGGSVTLSCESVPAGRRLSYCRFVRPDGAGYNFKGPALVADRYRYVGQGLDLGSCTIEIQHVQEEDFGEWTCGGRLLGHIAEGRDRITVVLLDSMSVATIIGIAVGLLTVLAVSTFTIIWTVRLRRARQASRRGSLPSQDSSNSSLEDFNIIEARQNSPTPESM